MPSEPSEQLAQIVVERVGTPASRGTGYHVGNGWVLTAHHVVEGAIQIGVWLGAPVELLPEAGFPVLPGEVLSAADCDLALLPLRGALLTPLDGASFGRLDRAASAPIPAKAAGFPRFKRRPAQRGSTLEIRDSHEANGTIAALSNARTGTYELSGLAVVPADEAEPAHSPWEGMSGAAVWADDRLIGVVAEHHPTDGKATLTVRTLEALFRSEVVGAPSTWAAALGPRFPLQADQLWPVTRRKLGDLALDRAQQDAASLAPPLLLNRERELDELRAFATSGETWRWLRGAAYAGKTALVASFVTRPPADTNLVLCFLRRTTRSNSAEYVLETLNAQLAAFAEQPGYQPARFIVDQQRVLGQLVADAAAESAKRSRRLLILLDGLDEYDDEIDVSAWLPESLPAGASMLVTSRSGAMVGIYPGHALAQHTHEVTASAAAREVQRLAEADLRLTLKTANSIQFAIIGYLCAASAPMTAATLHNLLLRENHLVYLPQVEDLLRVSLGRVVTELTNRIKPAEGSFAFAHAALQEVALDKFRDAVRDFHARIVAWGNSFKEARWPVETPDYVLRHYAFHLATLGRHDDLSELLDDPRWYERHAEWDPSLSAYLHGVQQIWSNAERRNSEEISSGLQPARLDLEIRCAAAASSIVSLSGLDGSLLTALATSGYWNHQALFETARRISDPSARAYSLCDLAQYFAEPFLSLAMREAYEATTAIQGEMERAFAVGTLAAHTPKELVTHALQFAMLLRAALPHDHRRPRAYALTALLKRYAELGAWEEALHLSVELHDERDRARTVASVAQRLPPHFFERVRDVALAMRWPEHRAEVFVGLASSGRHTDRPRLLRDAFDQANAASPNRSWLLRQLVAQMPPELLEDTVTIAREELSMGDRWTLLADAAMHLARSGRWERGLEIARSMKEENLTWFVRALAAVLPFAPEIERPMIGQETLDAATEDTSILRWELQAVFPFFSRRLLRKALWLIRSVGDSPDNGFAFRAALTRLARIGHPKLAFRLALIDASKLLNALIVHLPPPLQADACRRALAATRHIGDEEARLESVAGFGRHLATDRIRGLLRGMRQRRMYDVSLFEGLPQELVPDALEVADAVPEFAYFARTKLSSPRASALAAIAPRLNGSFRSDALRRASESISQIEDALTQVKLLATLPEEAGPPDPQLVETALTQVEVLADCRQRLQSIRAMERFLAPVRVEAVIEVCRASDQSLVQSTQGLLARVTDSDPVGNLTTLIVAFRRAKRVGDAELRRPLLRALAHYFEVLLQRDLNDGDGGGIFWQANVVEELAPHLQCEQLPLAMTTAARHEHPGPALRAIVERLTTEHKVESYRSFKIALRTLSTTPRVRLLKGLRELEPLIVAIAGKQAAIGTVDAIEFVANRWP